MISDDERREIATKLRKQADKLGPNMDAHEFANYTADVLDVDENMMWYGIELRLADLIEPEPERTCKNTYTGVGWFQCSRCGAFSSEQGVTNAMSEIPISYCSNCGAKVVDSET